MDQLTDFGRKLAIIVALVILFAILVAAYKLVYLPLAAVENRYWDILVTTLAICLAALMVGGTGWMILRLAGSARRGLTKHGRPVFAKTKNGKEFVGWELPDGTFVPKPQPAFGSQAQTISLNLGHQAYPPKYLMEQPRLSEGPTEEEEEAAMIPDATSTWGQEKPGMGPERFFLGWLAGGRKLWATFDELLVSIAVGMQGFGKTTLARLVMLQHAMWGGAVVIYDAYNDLAREMAGWFEEGYSDENEVELSAACVLEEVKARILAWRQGRRRFKPLLIVIDELTQYEGVCPSLVALIKQGSDVCRKARVRIFISVTRVPASSLGGKMTRDNTANVFVFKTMTKDLLNQFGIIGKLAETLHRLLFRLGTGYCVVRSGTQAIEGELLLLADGSPDLFKRELTSARMRGQTPWVPGWQPDTVDEDEVDFGLWKLAARRRAMQEATAPEVPAEEDLERFADDRPRVPVLPPLPMKKPAQGADVSISTISTPATERPEVPVTPLFGNRNKRNNTVKRPKVDEATRAEIIRLYTEEGLAYTTITRRLTGNVGGTFFYTVKEVLQEAGLLDEKGAPGEGSASDG